ncbi:hypothetical protein ACLBX9_14205 [Methylobacterium sp. A49B]
MMSKSPPPIELDADRPEDEFPGSETAPARSSARRLVSRIAKVLQVPEAALYDLPNARPSVRSSAPDASESAERENEGIALLEAFRRIGDPETRQRILRLAEAAADQA